jgi:hypothetical protein
VSFPRKALAELVAQLAGVECIWVEQRNPQVGATGVTGEAWIELVMTSDVPYGDGEYRQEPNEKNPEVLCSTSVLYKLVTISLRAKSFDTSIQPQELLADVRCQVAGCVTAAAMYAANNIAFVRTHPTAGIRGMTANNRVRLEATMDVVWSALDGGRAKDDPGTTIGSVNGGGVIPITGT